MRFRRLSFSGQTNLGTVIGAERTPERAALRLLALSPLWSQFLA